MFSDFLNRQFDIKFYHPKADRAGDALYFIIKIHHLYLKSATLFSDFLNLSSQIDFIRSKYYPEADRTGNALYFKATTRLVPITDIFCRHYPGSQ